MTDHNTGDNLLSHRSVAALPSAHVSLTSVFGKGTCVSLLLWSPEWLPIGRMRLSNIQPQSGENFQFIVITFNKHTIYLMQAYVLLIHNYKKKAVTNTFE